MQWKPVVAGIDASPEGIRAAVAAVELARVAETTCHLVHAVRDPWTEVSFTEMPVDLREQSRLLLDASRTLLVEALKGAVPPRAMDRLDVRFGPPSVVMSQAADDHDAELVVLGGKHHSTLGRWLAGSTVHHMVRIHDRPILVVGPPRPGATSPTRFDRVLAAVDLSSAAGPTLRGAERFVQAFGGDFRVLHVVEPLPLLPELPSGMEEEVLRRSEEQLEQNVWPLIGIRDAEHLVRQGSAAETITAVAQEWGADLVVLGTHGRGWVDRVLIGSVTERVLNRLPASVLVLPITGPGAANSRPVPADSSGARVSRPRAASRAH